jgi:hypothetical protein
MSPRIERVTTDIVGETVQEVHRELVADLPDRNGIYYTEAGIIQVTLGGVDYDRKLRKIVLHGEPVRTRTSDRRVVRLPLSPKKSVQQEVNPREYLVFSLSRIRR